MKIRLNPFNIDMDYSKLIPLGKLKRQKPPPKGFNQQPHNRGVFCLWDDWVDLGMINRIIPLLLFIGFVWGQADLDKLVLKDGTAYFGEYSKTEGDRVYFRHQDAFAFHPVPVKLIKQLQLKDGQIIIVGGKVKNSLTLEEYQKLSTKEKAIYDAKLINLWHWTFYCPLSVITLYPFLGKIQKMPSEAIAAIPMIGLTIPYFILNLKKVKFSYPESITHEYDRANYKKVYYKNIRERQSKIIMASIAITGCVAFLLFSQAMSDFDFGGDDFCLDPMCW